MNNEPNVNISNLIGQVKEELLRMGYGDRVIIRYQTVWDNLTEYMKGKSIESYNAKIGLDFLEEAYQITVFIELLNENKVRVRSIDVLNDYYLHGVILPK